MKKPDDSHLTVPLSGAAIAALAADFGATRTIPEEDEDPPHTLSCDRASPHYDACYKAVGVKFNGVERKGDVQAYDATEGWIDIRLRDDANQFRIGEGGAYVLERLRGKVEPYWRNARPKSRFDYSPRRDPRVEADVLRAADEKRKRKAAKRAAAAQQGD